MEMLTSRFGEIRENEVVDVAFPRRPGEQELATNSCFTGQAHQGIRGQGQARGTLKCPRGLRLCQIVGMSELKVSLSSNFLDLDLKF
jgi:hypothetical protein